MVVWPLCMNLISSGSHLRFFFLIEKECWMLGGSSCEFSEKQVNSGALGNEVRIPHSAPAKEEDFPQQRAALR